MTLKSYHFDLGDSNRGPVGFSARVVADSKKEALAILRDALPEMEEVGHYGGPDEIEYIQVYFNPANISIRDIDDWDEVE